MLNNELNFLMGLKCKVIGDEILICVDMKILFKDIRKVFEFLIIIYTNLGLGFRFELLLLMVPELRSFSVEFDLFVFLFLVSFKVEI